MMENLSDTEEIIPPTPTVEQKTCSLTSKSVQASKLSRKFSKLDHNSKRKRIISPDCKKVKQKAKQVTLYNFLSKGSKSTHSNASCNVQSSVKTNLLNKFDEYDSTNKSISNIPASSSLDSAKECFNLQTKVPVRNKTEMAEDTFLQPNTLYNAHSSIKGNLLNKFEESNSADKNINNIPASSSLHSTKECFNLQTKISMRNKIEMSEDAFLQPDASCNVQSSVKTNLLSKFEEYDSAGKIINNIPASSSLDSAKECFDLQTIVPVRNKTEMCEEVVLQPNSENNKVYEVLLDKNRNACHLAAENESNKHKINVEDDFRIADHSFSWMIDVEWDMEKENHGSICNSVQNVLMNNMHHSEEGEGCCMKFSVKNVEKDLSKNEIKLLVVSNDSAVPKTCYLRGFWTDSIINIGDTIHILKPLDSVQPVVDNDTGFIVTNPDFLISSTAVVSTLFCMRKAVLNHILPHWSPGNNIMMIGSLIHDIFQKSVNNHAHTPEEVLKIVRHVIKKRENLISICCQDIGESAIEEKVCKYVPNIVQWINKHCNFDGKNSVRDISILNVEDIEENVWCPKYGVKGKIDMTVNVQCPGQENSKLMPLELKTGRPTFSAEHIGQVNLYSLMMEERLKKASDGLLLYLRDKAEMKLINTNHNSKRGLIQLRNELASYVYKWVSSKMSVYEEIEQCHLPKPINNKRLCDKCPYLLPCTVYQKAFKKENNLDTDHAMYGLVPSSTDHLSDSHVEYFYHWSRLLLLENVTTAEVKAFWTEDAVKRERKGMCLSYVILDENVKVRQDIDSEFFIHTFTRTANSHVSSDFKSSCLKEGDYVAISNQNNLDEVAVAMGYIIKVCEKYFEIAVERNLGKLTRLKDCIFRIDKMVSNSAAACVRNNLMLLMQHENQAEKIRKLVIDKETPNFLESLPKQIALLGRPILKSLNKNQQKAILKAIMAKDYFLIKGMPGTGKTSTIVALVRLLVQMNISVLLTSYTHSAIDNILLKLKDFVEFVRIGPKYRIHPEVLEFSFENLTQDFSSADRFNKFMKEKMVVATTCLSINHAIFKLRKFDICIVDEASQINQIACMGPLFFAKKFILVGDEKQLPPLVLNNEARKNGMQESLFQRLLSPLNCIELTVQYRMNQEIMRICNELTYNGALQCGSNEVASAVLQLHEKDKIIEKNYPPWLLSAMSSDLIKSVMFLNTDNYNQPEREKSDIEADLVILLVQFLLQNDISQSDIGVIAPYRKQVDLIKTRLEDLKPLEIEVNTVDQYQGRDKDVIIISCVRPNDTLSKEEKTGIILDDEKRLNVAISRARKKLLLIGSKAILHGYKSFKNLITCLRSDQFLDIT